MVFLTPQGLINRKIDFNQWVLSRFHAILVTKNWSLLDPDPKLIIPDPDPANGFGYDRIRIHSTGFPNISFRKGF